MFHTRRPPLYCSTAQTLMHTHRANSAAPFTPCLPPSPPLALFMKACPLSAALSAPSCYGADYPHPESTSFALFILFSLPMHPLAQSLLREFSLLSPGLHPPSPSCHIMTYCSLLPCVVNILCCLLNHHLLPPLL